MLPEAFSQTGSGAIWLHAVSVGEVLSLLPLLRLLRDQIPMAPVYVSTSTTAARQVAEKQVDVLVDGIFYLPFDFGLCLRPAFQKIRPHLLIVLETEIWPNLFALAYEAGTRVALLNARISDRTWPTYRRWRKFFRPILRIPDLVQVQSRTDLTRFAQLGAIEETLVLDASLKYDATSVDAPLDLPTFGAELVWIAASTVGPNERGSLTEHSVDEDDLVLASFEELAAEFPHLLLILAPRQPARFDEVAAKLAGRGVPHQRRSGEPETLALPGVLLLDSIGELARAYPLADVVFVGGSLAPRGGHNIVEPAAAGRPVVIGPHMQNFATIAENFLEAEAVVQIQTAAELTPTIRGFLVDSARRREVGTRAKLLVDRQRGVSQRAVDRIKLLYFTGSFHGSHCLPLQMLLNGLARLWQLGGRYKRRRDLAFAAQQAPLAIPVISVGGLSVGGAGKTPFAVALAKLLRRRGFRPAILTRGYKRRSHDDVIAGSGASLSPAKTGDEAQIFLRANIGPVGIGAERYRTARLLLNQFPETDVLLLDDGFQHARLRRVVDIVLIDGLNPFDNGKLVPAGRLREPLSALSRADIAVVNRTRSMAQFQAIADKLREYNAALPVFRTHVQPDVWRDAKTGEPAAIAATSRALAFCGLGNPQSFWNTVDELGIKTVARVSFPDHHLYTKRDLQQLAARADVLLTTEKDSYNLPATTIETTILYLPIELTIVDEEQLMQLLLGALA